MKHKIHFSFHNCSVCCPSPLVVLVRPLSISMVTAGTIDSLDHPTGPSWILFYYLYYDSTTKVILNKRDQIKREYISLFEYGCVTVWYFWIWLSFIKAGNQFWYCHCMRKLLLTFIIISTYCFNFNWYY